MLRKLAMTPFECAAIQPMGWLAKQLQLQAEGLCGNLDLVWPDVRDSAWLGGQSEGWERVPYWLDGFIPMAYLLRDEQLIVRAKRYMNAILAQQAEDGWICPCKPEERKNYDLWAVLLIAKVMTVYADCSGDPRIQPALTAVLYQLNQHLNSNTLFDWGASRWFEGLIPIFWLYQRQPADWLLTLAHKLELQGFDWSKILHSGFLDQPKREWNFLTHVVNIAMMLKSEALMSRLDGRNADEFALQALHFLDEKHGMANGHFTGDECLAGDSPLQGSELCGVVEAMYSYEQLLSISGNAYWAERLEKLAFNALPAAISPDMWSHQYDQQTNQIECSILDKEHVVFGTNGGESHLYGLEPTYGCCTANFGQGWPKLALSAWMQTEQGITSVLPLPSQLSTNVQGVPVQCRLETNYPFREELHYTITVEQPLRFELTLRIPAAAVAATVNGRQAEPGSYYHLDQLWQGSIEIQVILRFETKIRQRPRDLVCVERGPLLYSVAIAERWLKREYEKKGVMRKFPYCDYEIFADSAWNYALTDANFSVDLPAFEAGFSSINPPVVLLAQMVRIAWAQENRICHLLPDSLEPQGASHLVKMIPYGCSNLRLTEFPFLLRK